jgi:hypothetical protein
MAAVISEQDNKHKHVQYVFQNFYLAQNIGFLMIF